MKFRDGVLTYGETLSPAMEITNQKDADEYFEALVEYQMRFTESREEAIRVVKINLGYWAGYYSNETRLRIEKLFQCSHPIFGNAIPKKPEETSTFNSPNPYGYN